MPHTSVIKSAEVKRFLNSQDTRTRRWNLRSYIPQANTVCTRLQKHSRRLHTSGHTTASHTFRRLAYSACKCWQNTGTVLHGVLSTKLLDTYVLARHASQQLPSRFNPVALKLNHDMPRRTRPCRCQSGACRQLRTGDLRRQIRLVHSTRNCILTCFLCLTTYHFAVPIAIPLVRPRAPTCRTCA